MKMFSHRVSQDGKLVSITLPPGMAVETLRNKANAFRIEGAKILDTHLPELTDEAEVRFQAARDIDKVADMVLLKTMFAGSKTQSETPLGSNI